MGKFASTGCYDGGFNTFKTASGTVTQTLCSAQPSNYAGIATNKLASVTIDKTNDITLSTGDTANANSLFGRKMTIAAKSAVSVTASGTGTHVVIDNGTEFFVTTCPSTAVAAGGTVDIGTWKDDVQAPV